MSNLLYKIGLIMLLSMILIYTVKLIDGDNHTLGTIQLPNNIVKMIE